MRRGRVDDEVTTADPSARLLFKRRAAEHTERKKHYSEHFCGVSSFLLRYVYASEICVVDHTSSQPMGHFMAYV